MSPPAPGAGVSAPAGRWEAFHVVTQGSRLWASNGSALPYHPEFSAAIRWTDREERVEKV